MGYLKMFWRQPAGTCSYGRSSGDVMGHLMLDQLIRGGGPTILGNSLSRLEKGLLAGGRGTEGLGEVSWVVTPLIPT